MFFSDKEIEGYVKELEQKDRSANTIKAYQSDIKTAKAFLEGKELTIELLQEYRDYMLQEEKFKPSTVNRKLNLVNNILRVNGESLNINPVKVQQRLTIENYLSESDYDRLIRWAEKMGDTQSLLIMEVLAATGIRIGELSFLTVEAMESKVMEIDHKGTIRKVPIVAELRKKLKGYCAEKGITEGVIFVSKFGNPLSTEYISRKLKKIAGKSKVKLAKVHPHNFRHLFAVHYLQGEGQIQELKDILGHKSLDTTVIYTRMNEKSIAKKMEANSLLRKSKKKANRKG